VDYTRSKCIINMKIYTSNPKQNNLSKKKILSKLFNNFINKGEYILANETKKFEYNFAKYIGTKYCIGVANGTDAIKIVLKSLKIKKGDEVIVSSHTANATIVGIEESGGTPVLIDIEKDYYTSNFESFKKMITQKTKAVVLVHIFGQTCDMVPFINYCKSKKIYLIEDVAQAHGAKFKNMMLGSIGIAGCFSFYPTKNLAALGDGGAITTNSKLLANRILKVRQYGWDKNRNINIIKGTNSRLDELQSYFLNIKLSFLDIENKKRNKIATTYNKFLTDKIIKPKIRPQSYHVFHIYCIEVKNRTELLKFLEKNNIFLSRHYDKVIFKNKLYKNLKKDKKLINIFELYKYNLSLPIYPELSWSDQMRVIKNINKFYND